MRSSELTAELEATRARLVAAFATNRAANMAASAADRLERAARARLILAELRGQAEPRLINEHALTAAARASAARNARATSEALLAATAAVAVAQQAVEEARLAEWRAVVLGTNTPAPVGLG